MSQAPIVDLEFRVRYAESDQMGVAYYANYLIWFEMGRSEFCRQVGLPYTQIEEAGFCFVVAEARCRYKRPARYDDLLIVRTSMTECKRRVCRFGYQVYNAQSDQLLADGDTVHVVVDMESGRPVALPDDILNAFRGCVAGSQ